MKRNKFRILSTELEIASWKHVHEYNKLKDNVRAKARLVEQLILYDRVYIATRNFLVIPLLVDWFGLDTLLKLLYRDVLGFVRTKGFLAYDGKYKSIEWLEVQFPVLAGKLLDDGNWLRVADSRDTKSAVSAVLKGAFRNLKDSDGALIYEKVVSNTKEISNINLGTKIAAETERDLENEELRRALKINVDKVSEAGLDLGENQLKIGIEENEFDPIRATETEKILAVAFSNYDLILGRLLGDVDIHTDILARNVLKAKMSSVSRSDLKAAALDKLVQLRNIPDFVALVEKDSTLCAKLIDLANVQETLKFRVWLHSLDLDAEDAALKDYLAKLEKHYDGPPIGVKAARFLVTAGLGLVPGLSIPVSPVDSFVLDELLKQWHPKLFLDKLRSVSKEYVQVETPAPK